MRLFVFAFGFSAAIAAPLTAQQVTASTPVVPEQAPLTDVQSSRAVIAPISNAPVSSASARVIAPATTADGAPSTVAPTATVGPTTETARAGVAPRESKTLTVNSSATDDRHVGAGQNVALMIVGGAALITGVIIGGDGGTLLAVGGTVVGLFGLYNFVK